MQTFVDYLLVLMSENKSIGINTDILETNVINIILLLILLFVVIKNFLTDALGTRKNKIVGDVENAEKRLSNSTHRYQESQKQWSQIQIIVENIYNQTNETKETMLKEKCNQSKQELSRKFSAAAKVLYYREQSALNDIIREVSERAINRVVNKLQVQLNNSEQSNIIDRKIELLGGS